MTRARAIALGPAYAEIVTPVESGVAAGTTGVLVLPDGRGLHDYYRALAAGFAGLGAPALAMDFYGRTAGAPPRGPDFRSGEHSAQLHWTEVREDLAAGVRFLRGVCGAERVAVVGFCLGGRIALLAATLADLRLSAAVAFYPQTHGAARSDLPAPDELTSGLTCPVLSVFGADDELIPASEITLWQQRLATSRVTHDVVTYPDAGHSFFDRESAAHRPQCADAWRRTLDFLDLSARAGAAR